MARPDSPAARADRGRLRTSRAEREQVIATLKVAFVQGRLTKDEFDARVAETFGSRTYAELAELTADIPAGLAESRLAESRPARPARSPANKTTTTWLLVTVALIPVAVIVIANVTGNAMAATVIAPMLFAYFMVAMIAVAHLLDSRLKNHSRKSRGPRAVGRGML